MKFPTIINGTAKNSDLSVMVGGVEKKGHDAYVIVNGVAKLFYKNAIEWTTEITESHDRYLENYSYGNDDTQTAFVYGENTNTYYYIPCMCTVIYNFNEPLNLKTGQTINIYSGGAGHANWSSLTFDNDSSPFYNWGIGEEGHDDYTYTLPADRTISSIKAWTKSDIETENNGGCVLKVTINSDYGSFLLNNSGTSNQ